MNNKAIINGQIYIENKLLLNKAIIFNDKIIDIIDSSMVNDIGVNKIIDAKGNYILPGLIDIHIHGYKGKDIMDGELNSIEYVAKEIVKCGVTSFLPTTMTLSKTDIRRALNTIRIYMKNNINTGAQALGVHLEGPFINKEYIGAQNLNYIMLPDKNLIEGFDDVIKIITLAPELEGAMRFIREYSNKNIIISIGHSGADFDTTIEAFESGAKGTTHTFNAMSGLHHRNLGVVGAALLSNCYTELIADNIHVKPEIYKLMIKNKNIDRIILVTDCIRATGLSDGVYELGEQKITIIDGKSYLKENVLAGSTLMLNKGLNNFLKATESTIEKAIKLVTENPAKYINMYDKKGSLHKGKDADIIIVNNDIDIIKTYVKGNEVFSSENP